MIRSELERGIMSYRFFLCILGAIVIVVLGAWDGLFLSEDALKTSLQEGYHLSLLKKALQGESIVFALPLLSTIPYSGMFLEEYQSRFQRIHVTRSTRMNYVASKVITTGVCGGFGVFTGILFITGILKLVYQPLESKATEASTLLFYQVFSLALIVSLMGALWASLGAFLGVVCSSTYMTYGGPFLTSYLCIILTTRYLKGLFVLNPREWLLQDHYAGANSIGIIVFLLILYTIVQLLEGIAIWKKIECI
ncbi:MAG: hypothetical protein K0S47_2579 [Herbinix sp.]|nr:hypothetical protein [Herbinix sp.]